MATVLGVPLAWDRHSIEANNLMAHAARAFNDNQGTPMIRAVEDTTDAVDAEQLPWRRIQDGQMPPMMFQLRMRDGVHESFPYGDIRRIRCRDAGTIQIEMFSSPRTNITIEGRHLRELAVLLSNAMVRWIEESEDRSTDRPEHVPTITRLRVELSPSA